jgi:polyphosphate kinase
MTTFTKSELYINREISWLDFNERVLQEALDKRNPLLERAKFIAIFSNNLDEFFMKRVGGLKRMLAAGTTTTSMDGMTAKEQFSVIRERVVEQIETQRSCLIREIIPSLRRQGLTIVDYSKLKPEEKSHVDDYYKRSVFPILIPLGVGPGQPFPFLSNLSLSLAVRVRKPQSNEIAYARVKIPQNRPRWIETGIENHFVPLEQLIAANLKTLFPGMEIVESTGFRVTRNADVDRNEEEAEDLLDMMEEEVRHRRFAPVVRLEIENTASRITREWLSSELGLTDDDIYDIKGPLGLPALFSLTKLDFPKLKDKAWSPVTNRKIRELDDCEETKTLFELIKKGDFLVHHPYESFATSVERFMKEAALDPNVLAIKQTLYRTADNSPIIRSLVTAAEYGKQVAVLVEIKARFDEVNNIHWVRTLERAGVHVTYGFPNLKTHTKTLLVIREEPDGIKRYFHIGTGNYHSGTAKLYTDLGLFSCRTDIGEDLTDLFNFLTGHSQQKKYRKMLIAPVNMRQKFRDLIDREIQFQSDGKPARIIAKMNSLEDQECIDHLYRASKAGVKIDLIVRGLCCLRPGIPELSENITVISIIGRFLEHPRIFYFHNNGEEEYYIGSADWMSRNLDNRVEAIVPIEDKEIQQELWTMLDIQLKDNRNAWVLQSNGQYVQRRPKEGEKERGSHEVMMKHALRKSN